MRAWLLSFVMGMCLAHTNGIVRVRELLAKLGMWRWVLLFAVTFTLALLYWKSPLNDGCKYCLLAWAITQLSYEVTLCMPRVQRFLVFVGKHSFNIFLFHTFIFRYYFHDQIYAFRNPLLIFCVLLSVCLVISMALEWLKRVIHFRSCEVWVINKLSRENTPRP